jgi:hypothetical protein
MTRSDDILIAERGLETTCDASLSDSTSVEFRSSGLT